MPLTIRSIHLLRGMRVWDPQLEDQRYHEAPFVGLTGTTGGRGKVTMMLTCRWVLGDIDYNNIHRRSGRPTGRESTIFIGDRSSVVWSNVTTYVL